LTSREESGRRFDAALEKVIAEKAVGLQDELQG